MMLINLILKSMSMTWTFSFCYIFHLSVNYQAKLTQKIVEIMNKWGVIVYKTTKLTIEVRQINELGDIQITWVALGIPSDECHISEM